jgi:hypothetical protein
MVVVHDHVKIFVNGKLVNNRRVSNLKPDILIGRTNREALVVHQNGNGS